MSPCSLIALAVVAAAPDPELTAAERAFEDARYEEVLPALKSALQHALGDPERHRALELLAITQAAFDDRSSSVEAFRRLLALDPAYEPDPSYGPKVRGWWEQAMKLGPLGLPQPKPPPVEAPKPPPDVPRAQPRPQASKKTLPPAARPRPVEKQEGEPPLYERWYLWAGAGGATAIVVGVIAGVALARPAVPAGNLGTGALH